MKLSNRHEKIKFLNDCLAGKRSYNELRPVRITVFMYDSKGNITKNGKPLTDSELKSYENSIKSGKMITIKANTKRK